MGSSRADSYGHLKICSLPMNMKDCPSAGVFYDLLNPE